MKNFIATLGICVFITLVYTIGSDIGGVWGFAVRMFAIVPLWGIVEHYVETRL